MSDFHFSVAESTPRAIRGTVIKVQKIPVSLELGKIVLDKEEVRIKDILSEMNLMANVSQVGTMSEDTSSGNLGGLKGFNQMLGLFDMLKNLMSKVKKGNKKERKEDKPEDTALEIAKDILNTIENIPQFNNDPIHDDYILILISEYLKEKIEDKGDPFAEFLLDLSSLFLDLNSYLDKEFSKSEKLNILKKLNIHTFFERFKFDIEPYIRSMSLISNSLNNQIESSTNDLIDRVKSTDKKIEDTLKRESDIIEANKKNRERRDQYKAYKIQEELDRLESNPTEEKIIYRNEYDIQLERLRELRS